jgi:hypothetical protein
MSALTRKDLGALRPGQKVRVRFLSEHNYHQFPDDIKNGDILTLANPPTGMMNGARVLNVRETLIWYSKKINQIKYECCELIPEWPDKCTCDVRQFLTTKGCSCGFIQREIERRKKHDRDDRE